MTRVLFLAKYLDAGGVTTHMHALATRLVEHGYRVGLACGGKVGEHNHGLDWFRAAGVDTFYVPFPGRRFSPAQAIQALTQFAKVVYKYRPNLIHVHWRATSPYAYIASLALGIPVVSTLHLDGIPCRGVYQRLSFWGDRVIAISSETREYLKTNFRVPEKRIRTVFNGVDETVFRPPTSGETKWARRQLSVPNDAKVIGIVARLVKAKGHDVLLRAAAKLKKKGMPLQVICAGTGSQREEIIRLVLSYNLKENVLMTGYIDSRLVLWASDVFALPSRQEGFPLSVVEAMLCGVVPIRTPSAGAYDQISDGVDGFITPFEDHETLAARIELLLTNGRLRKAMSHAAYEKAQRLFTLTQMVRNTIAVYEEVLEKH